jgi:hypothetical protein
VGRMTSARHGSGRVRTPPKQDPPKSARRSVSALRAHPWVCLGSVTDERAGPATMIMASATTASITIWMIRATWSVPDTVAAIGEEMTVPQPSVTELQTDLRRAGGRHRPGRLARSAGMWARSRRSMRAV